MTSIQPLQRDLAAAAPRHLQLHDLRPLLIVLITLLLVLPFGQPAPLAADVGVWTQLDLDNIQITAVTVDPSNPNTSYAGTSGRGIFRSTDAGQNWTQINNGLGNLYVNDILVSPADPSIVLAGTGRGPLVGDPGEGLYRSTNQGTSWTSRLAGFIGDIDVSPQNSQVMYAAGAPAVFRSTNGGADWVQAFTDASVFQNVDMRAVAVSPADTNVVLVGGTTEGGTGSVFRTINGGQAWTRVQDSGIPFVTSVVFSSSNSQLAFFGNGQGLWRSRDAGATWGVVFGGPAVLELLRDPLDGNTFYAGTSGQGVFQTTNGGDTFQALNVGLGNLMVHGLGIDRTRPQTVWAGTDDGIWGFTFTAPGPTPTPSPTSAPGTPTPTPTPFGQLPSLVLSPTSGAPGTPVNYSGSRFTPGGRASVLVIRGVGIVVDTVTADQNGNVSGTFPMPSPSIIGQLQLGPVDVFAIDAATGRETGPSTFTLGRSAAAVTWFFAEGSTAAPFDTWYLVQNPGDNDAQVRFTFSLEGGATAVSEFNVEAHSRFSLFANQILPGRALSVRIDADQRVFAERAMYVGYDGHAVTGIAAPSTSWFFAEGSTQPPFDTWLLLQNPNEQTTPATITYLIQGGGSQTQTLLLPPTSRTSVFVNQVLDNVAFSSQVRADRPIIAERAMYRFPGNAATAVPGVTQASRTWFFAEGNTSVLEDLPTDTFLLLQNPNAFTVATTITLFRELGTPVTLTRTLPPSSRQTLFLNNFVQGSFGISVEAAAEIIAERSMFFGVEPRGAHATVGAPELGTEWHLAEGSTAPPFEEFIAIMNPNGQDAAATIEFQLPSGFTLTQGFDVPARSKLSILVDSIIPDSAVSAEVKTSLPTVVERTMFIFELMNTGGTNTIGVR